MSTAANVYRGIIKAVQNQANIFYIPLGYSNTFTTSITKMNNVINEETLAIANLLGRSSNVDVKINGEINEMAK